MHRARPERASQGGRVQRAATELTLQLFSPPFLTPASSCSSEGSDAPEHKEVAKAVEVVRKSYTL